MGLLHIYYLLMEGGSWALGGNFPPALHLRCPASPPPIVPKIWHNCLKSYRRLKVKSLCIGVPDKTTAWGRARICPERANWMHECRGWEAALGPQIGWFLDFLDWFWVINRVILPWKYTWLALKHSFARLQGGGRPPPLTTHEIRLCPYAPPLWKKPRSAAGRLNLTQEGQVRVIWGLAPPRAFF